AAELVEQLRRQGERMREARRRLGKLALRLQHATDIIIGLGMIRLEQQQSLIEAGGLGELVLPLAVHRLREQRPDQIAVASATASARRALLERGPALFSIYLLSVHATALFGSLLFGGSTRRLCL